MRKSILFFGLLLTFWTLSLIGQNNASFLNVRSFGKDESVATFILPQGMNDEDINGHPWAMIKVVAKGFDSEMLNDIKISSPSSLLVFGLNTFDQAEGCYKIILSAGVEGELVFAYQDTKLSYKIPGKLKKKNVYKLELEMRSANLTIIATPAESRIFIDGNEVGSDGYASVDLRLGEHTYSVECDKHISEKNKTIRLERNESLEINLKPLFGYISITSNPSGADVFINEVKVGETPYINNIIERGRNNVVLRLDGYYDKSAMVEIGLGEQKQMNVTLTKFGEAVSEGDDTYSAEPSLYISRDSLFFGPDHSHDSIFVTTNNLEWSFKDAPRWLSLCRKHNVLYITCLENTVHNVREANVTVCAGDLSEVLYVSQEEGRVMLKSQSNNLEFLAERDTVAQKIETNVVDWNITVSDDWFEAYEKGDSLIVVCKENSLPISRHGEIVISSFDQELRLNVSQYSMVSKIIIPNEDTEAVTDDSITKRELVINSRPDWKRVYVDGVRIGRTPVVVAADDSIHHVKLGREKRSCAFNDINDQILFNTGMRYLQFTLSGETMGFRTGYIGSGRWGGYNHFQLKINNWDIIPGSDIEPMYVYSLGPTFEVLPWMSVYSGVGIGLVNDTTGVDVEAGVMIYYRNIMASCGIQYNDFGKNHNGVDFSAGLGLYFNRYYDKKHGYCATRSRQWWSFNAMYNPVKNGYGFMFNSLGMGNLRWYFKTMGEFNTVEQEDEFAPLLTAGFVFNLMPGYINFMVGAGYQAAMVSKQVLDKGVQAEIGFVINVWRFPLTIMMRYAEFNKDSRNLTVDLGVGFSFGNYLTNKNKK